MREILFKAQRIDNGEWVEGFYVNVSNIHFYIFTGKLDISNGYLDFEKYSVNPETVCRFTGFYDKNGNKIWENDICNALLALTKNGFKDEKEKCVVKYGRREENFKIELGFYLEWTKTDYWRCDICFWTENRELEVIGNIFDGELQDDSEKTKKD